MRIKTLLTRLVENITGKKCSNCRHNYNGNCYHPESDMFMRCWHGITKPGYEDRGGPVKETLTQEEQHQLNKIKAVLRDAEDEARESGLLTED